MNELAMHETPPTATPVVAGERQPVLDVDDRFNGRGRMGSQLGANDNDQSYLCVRGPVGQGSDAW